MQTLFDAWPVAIFCVFAVMVVFTAAKSFLASGRDEQIKSLKQFLLYAVVESERRFGGKTGKLKLAFVYNYCLSAFPGLAKLISFETFAALVDEALAEMKKMLEENAAIADYVEGKGKAS